MIRDIYNNLWVNHKTQITGYRDAGYKLPAEELSILNMTLDEYITYYRSKQDSEVYRKIWTAKKNQIVMLKERGYYIDQEDLSILSFCIEDFVLYFRTKQQESMVEGKLPTFISTLRKVYTHTSAYSAPAGYENHPSFKMYVTYISEPEKKNQVSVDSIRNLITIMNEYGISRSIVIHFAPLSPSAKKELNDIEQNVELFDPKFLLYNPTEHKLVPKHILLTPEEKEAKIKELKFKKAPLHSIMKNIKSSDIIVKYYGWEKGSIIKVIRHDGSIVYRVIV